MASLAEQYRGWCRHFTGIHHDVCKKGHRYDDFPAPVFRTAPCFARNIEPSPCPDRDFPSAEEAEAAAREMDAAFDAHLEKLKRRECPTCSQTYRGKQVGRCVYCEHCGTRLYQGTAPELGKRGERDGE